MLLKENMYSIVILKYFTQQVNKTVHLTLEYDVQESTKL